MQKYHGFDQIFLDYLFNKIVKDGGIRLQIIASQMVKQLQENYDTKDPLNLYRKQYGNIYQALKAIKPNKQFFILDNMVIKMKSPEMVRKMDIRKDLIDIYQQKLVINRNEQIKIMKINNQNQCKVCQKVYNIFVNKPGLCGHGPHQPLHQ